MTFKSLGGVLIVGSLLTLIGCASVKPVVYQYSGYLSDYSKLTADTSHEGLFYYLDKNLPLYNYSKIIIQPIEVSMRCDHIDDPQGKEDVLKNFKIKYYMTVQDSIQDIYPLVNFPERDALLLRSKILSVTCENRNENPIHSKSLLDVPLDLTGAAIEMEVVDAMSNERLVTVIDTLSGSKFGDQGHITKWRELEQAFSYWMKLLKQQLHP
ncbi:MAG: DUF3313 domain-containing protein [Candidatus Omnitrophica bacterium]|nr:DUF3313 domain-containing protein [Candidatus Omnitrophota bacterium]